ncbi:MAG: BlaI/MecI/CopY family transcriptional regulator [Firmicutes bacterium]|nr:BlaI/MecI/CopY family transcriptional regulator [Bacillota bacterium]
MTRFFEFKPHERGLEKVLGGLEAEIMTEVWSCGRCTVRDIHDRLRSRKDLAYTTVMTVMGRLAQKGLLNREMVEGVYYYEPAMSRDEFEGSVAAEVLDGLLEAFSEKAIAHLLGGTGKANREEVERLARIIEERRKEKRG